MTNLARYIDKQHKELKDAPAAALPSKKAAIIKSYKAAGIMTARGTIKPAFK